MYAIAALHQSLYLILINKDVVEARSGSISTRRAASAVERLVRARDRSCGENLEYRPRDERQHTQAKSQGKV